ncbi:MAG TPA: hypothetical protein VFW09_01160 [Solirubrobacteraceae bacterium]|jgi:hypothetical protein|nr:hypothetical protein [Solirubrobacteraceae bacterium]
MSDIDLAIALTSLALGGRFGGADEPPPHAVAARHPATTAAPAARVQN